MLDIRLDDVGPMVAVVQTLINRREGMALLEVDGEFGALTQEGVRRVQSAAGLPDTGAVDLSTWNTLADGQRIGIVNANDIYDPRHDWSTPDEWRNAGLIPTGGMSGGVGNVIGQAARIASEVGPIILLRFFGHGRAGLMAVSAGTGRMRDVHGGEIVHDRNNPRPNFELHQSIITTANFRAIEGQLTRLRQYMAPLGSIEFHGCHVGEGEQGRRLLQLTAQATGVPASGGIGAQSFGPLTGARFEGRMRTIYPHGRTLVQWLRTRGSG